MTNCIEDTTGRIVLKTQQDELYWRHNRTNCIEDTTWRIVL